MQTAIWKTSFVVIALLVVSVWGHAAYRDRESSLALGTERLQATANVLTQYAERALEVGDVVIKSIVRDAAETDFGDPEALRRLHLQIAQLVESSPQISSVWIVDADAITVAENWSHPPGSQGSFAERDYFRAHRGGDDAPALYIGTSQSGSTTGRSRFTLSRTILAADGGFKGVAVTGVYGDHFAEISGQAGLGEDALFTLRSDGGEVLAQWPHETVERDDPLAEVVADLSSYPAFVTVSRPLSSLTAEAQTRALASGLSALAVIVGFGLLTWRGVQAARQESEARRALQDANRHLEERVEERTAHQTLLLNELNHRVKNTLATVQAIVSQGLGKADPELRDAIEGRLFALGRSHDLLTRTNWEGTTISAVAGQVAEAFAGDEATRFRIEGAEFWLMPRSALALGMALHELATNAAKYGALSVPSGQVCIEWRATGEDRLVVEWREEGGPPVTAPTRRGFGTRLIETGLSHDLGGTVDLGFDPSGVRCTMEVPFGRTTCPARRAA